MLEVGNFLISRAERGVGEGENTSKAQRGRVWKASPAPRLGCCKCPWLGSAAGTGKGRDTSSSGKTPTLRHCLFPELLQCSLWMEKLLGQVPPPAASGFLFCAQQCLISPHRAERCDSEGARLASASCACRQGRMCGDPHLL